MTDDCNFVIDEENATPSMRQYLKIKKEYKDYLVFYRMGDFYELFYQDAVMASKALDLVLTSRTKDQDVPMCGVPYHAYESYLARLIHQGYKVAIAEQTETPDEAKKRGRNALVNREVIRIVTPGTLTEDNLLDARCNNFLLCVVKNVFTLGFAWIDMSTGDFFTKKIESDISSLGSDIYNIFSKIDPSEIIISDALFQDKSLLRIFDAYTERLTVLPLERFNFENALRRIKNFYHIESLDSFGTFSNTEICSAGTILDYIDATQKGQMPRIKNLIAENEAQVMEIDGATRRSLELIESANGLKEGAFLKNIDKTLTGFGARLFRHRLLNPSLNVFEINRRLDCAEFFYQMPEMSFDLRALFKKMSDVERVVTRLSAQKGGPRDILALKQTLFCIPKIKNTIQNYGKYGSLISKLPDAINNMLKKISNFSALVDFLDDAIKDVSESKERLPLYARDGDFIRDGFDPRLDSLRNLKKNNVEITQKLAEQYAKEFDVSGLKIKYNTIMGYYIEVPKKSSDTLFANPKFIHRQTVLNAVRFTTAELAELEQNINSADEKALAIELEIYNEMVTQILAQSSNLSLTTQIIAEIDVACAVAELARERGYTRPVLDDTLCFEIKDGKHPVVEAALKKMHEGEFVSNNCSLDGKKNRLWLITGPNMAGKSTFLRQNALIAIMAQMGLFVPASYAHIGIIDKIFSRVGASDDLSRGRSTFMVAMVETAAILNQATEKSFVILDEIGRGTATFDGLSIAWAVVEHLVEVNKCRALFATHYHELTVLSDKLKALSLHAMKIKEYKGNVVFMHEVIDGMADRSYGVHVAKLAGVPKLVTARAEQILKSLESNAENKKITAIEDDLPLFSVFQQKQKTQEADSALTCALKALNPDNLTPREALDKIYEIKALFLENEKQ